MSVRLLSVMIATGCAVAAATACSSPSAPEEVDIKKATQASSVTIQMFDKSGSELGSCSGTLVSKDLVLTAGHCAAGVASWKIDSRGADTKSTATRAVTPWKAFGSSLAHPDHSDVALLVLQTPIELDRYPSIATSALSSGARALHFRRSSAGAAAPGSSTIEVSSGRAKGFRLNYVAKGEEGAFLDTGGAVVDPKTGKIVGVVSGKGTASGLLHIARTDSFAKWITMAGSCGESGGGVSPRDYSSSSSSSGGWGGYGGSSGSGGTKLDAAPPPPYGGDGGGGSSSGSSGTSGSSGSSGSSGKDGGASGTPGDGTDTPGGNGGSSCPGTPSCEGNDCPGKGAGGTPGGGGTPGDDTPGGGGGDDVCPGPPGCPEPDSQDCSGPSCGGCGGVAGCADSTIDYGGCASCGSGGSGGGGPVLR